MFVKPTSGKNLILSAIVMTIISAPAFAATGGAHWGYEGHEGPSHWGDLSPKYSTCQAGKKQSPINLTRSVLSGSKNIDFNFKDVPMSIVNNGHTIQVNYAAGSSSIIRGKEYQLKQFHFHGPSEHAVNGKLAPMELHMVHVDADGNLAVVGVMLIEGTKNKAIDSIWKNMPNEHGKNVNLKGESINATSLLPANKAYFHYSGSLTTPPCSEGVNWNVMTTPIEVSSAQIASFKKLFKHNNRPVQSLNGRSLKISKR